LRDGYLSEIVSILFGVPQGSVVGPILFILYVVEVFGIIASYGLDCHSYADDTQCSCNCRRCMMPPFELPNASHISGPHHSSPTQPPLAAGAANDLFQDCGPRMEMHPFHSVAPPYLQEVCLPVEKVQGRSRLRSASTGCVDLPRVQTSVGQRSFVFHRPTVWNSLPSALRDSSLSLNTFRRRLKTRLFGQS